MWQEISKAVGNLYYDSAIDQARFAKFSKLIPAACCSYGQLKNLRIITFN